MDILWRLTIMMLRMVPVSPAFAHSGDFVPIYTVDDGDPPEIETLIRCVGYELDSKFVVACRPPSQVEGLFNRMSVESLNAVLDERHRLNPDASQILVIAGSDSLLVPLDTILQWRWKFSFEKSDISFQGPGPGDSPDILGILYLGESATIDAEGR